LAAQRATKKDVLHLREILAEAGARLEEGAAGWDAFIRVDNRIHMALARMAGNPIYESVLETVYDHIHRYFDRFLPREEEMVRENHEDLRRIVKAVEERKASRAGVLVQDHVRKFNRIMEENARKQGAVKGQGRP
ncbi:MAG: FadR family transcriptional regulator, partial [Deltaproteobacteria bacterium]|nr:FadR family transcriptional regulator [Deltaproteobacteria bacterium]